MSGSEEGGSKLVLSNGNVFMLCLCSVGCRAREHMTMMWNRCDVSVGHQMQYQSEF
jgi:hypothetical protein